MKCKHCTKNYKDCPYYVAEKDGCCFTKNKEKNAK